MVELKVSAYAKPLEAPSGFHIFKALSVPVPTREVPEFSAPKGRISAQLRAAVERELRERVAKEASVKRSPEHLVPGR